MSPRPWSSVRDPFAFDRALLRGAGRGLRYLAGADEVGRGCLAGPLVCAAVVLDYGAAPQRLLQGLGDSKSLTIQRREDLYTKILSGCSRWSVISVSASSLDAAGLHRSNLVALGEALAALGAGYDLALVDGFELERPELGCRRLVGGDRLSAAVAAASVLAKVTRDRWLTALHDTFPAYDFAHNKGYGTPAHLRALATVGPCPEHRLSFRRVLPTPQPPATWAAEQQA